jgi:hypothetical protein
VLPVAASTVSGAAAGGADIGGQTLTVTASLPVTGTGFGGTDKHLNACRFHPVAGGLGDWVYASTVQGYLSLVDAGATDGSSYPYRAESATLDQWEIGRGFYDEVTGTFTRTIVLFSSNAGAKVDFTTIPQVAITFLAEDLVSKVPTGGAAHSVLTKASTVDHDMQWETTSSLRTLMGVREVLVADRHYYVEITGNNTTGDGSVGTPWATPQKAIDAVAVLDISIYNAYVHLGAGTFAGVNQLKRPLGTGTCYVIGAGSTTIISSTGDTCFFGSDCGRWQVESLKLTGGYAFLFGGYASNISGVNLEYGTCTTYHRRITNGAQFRDYAATISGGAARHISCDAGGKYTSVSVTHTLVGTPAFSQGYAVAETQGFIWVEGMTYSGAATGPRFALSGLSMIKTATNNLNFLPGNAAGTIGIGCLYDTTAGA